jgi:hypothetical protein
MNRSLAFIGALLLTLVSVSTTCFATPGELVTFRLEAGGDRGGEIRATFRDDDERNGRDHSWSTGFPASELSGLDVIGFRGPGTRPLRFAIVREAGRFDCAGSGGESDAHGNCRFTSDPNFMQLLASRGIKVDDEDRWGLMALNVRRELIEAIAAAGYPTPTADDLMALAALGVDRRYISELARAGYRPQRIDTLVQFKAMGITPEWIGGFVRIGYPNIPADGLVQFKALGITPDFVSGFDKVGYRHLPVDSLVQLKALGITPDFARWAASQRSSAPPVDELVQMKIFGNRPPR